MSISVFQLFSIGVGPSSSHTVGPMRAAKKFVEALQTANQLAQCDNITIELFGSLALTGVGHGTDGAILAGLEGNDPETIEPSLIPKRLNEIKSGSGLKLLQQRDIHFDYANHLQWLKKQTLPQHSNAMRFSAWDKNKNCLLQTTYFSIGGGFIATEETLQHPENTKVLPYPFKTAEELFDLCKKNNLTIAQLMLENEKTWRSEKEIKEGLIHIANIMAECIEKGLHTRGTLPGGLNVMRRAPELYRKLQERGLPLVSPNPEATLWPTVFAMAVNEENAAGGRVVTAPTNGAAGIIPSVLTYYRKFYQGANDEKVVEFLLTAGAIGLLYKFGASISGAEVGCQGEVGVACSMAAGALTATLGGTLMQIENAAEMAMEHHLGMTCDPIAGLVQIPCIERNGVAAEKAIKLTQLALLEEGSHKKVSLDKVIKTMLKTGKDMMTIYKETSLGGLAANVPEC